MSRTAIQQIIDRFGIEPFKELKIDLNEFLETERKQIIDAWLDDACEPDKLMF